MTSKLTREDYMTFSEGLAQYVYINDIGRLDLEDFCVTLAACIHHDGIGYQDVARPENFHALLIQLISERAPEGMFERWVQPQRIADWTPQHAYLYPNKERTCIHVAALISYSHDWIALIGSNMLEIPDDEWRPEYFGWAKENWHFTHMFLSGFHNELYSFAKKMDLKSSGKGSPSKFEALQLSMREDISFDEATSKIDIRNNAWHAASLRIEKSIDDGYYLEAITLSENFISNLLYNYLSYKGKVNSDLNFSGLIQKCKPHFVASADLAMIEDVDSWRKSRNNAIHNFVSSSIDDLTANTDTLTESSSSTARLGQALTKQVLDWYRAAAVDFIQHNFPRSQLDA